MDRCPTCQQPIAADMQACPLCAASVDPMAEAITTTSPAAVRATAVEDEEKFSIEADREYRRIMNFDFDKVNRRRRIGCLIAVILLLLSCPGMFIFLFVICAFTS